WSSDVCSSDLCRGSEDLVHAGVSTGRDLQIVRAISTSRYAIAARRSAAGRILRPGRESRTGRCAPSEFLERPLAESMWPGPQAGTSAGRSPALVSRQSRTNWVNCGAGYGLARNGMPGNSASLVEISAL